MRRYDPGYRQVKASLESGRDRRRADPPQRAPQRHGRRVVHELHDDDRLDDPRGRHHPLAPGRGDHRRPGRRRPSGRRKAFPHLQDPQFAMFTTETGILSTVEFFANCQYGYDVRCELVGSLGTASMTNPGLVQRSPRGSRREHIPPDWRDRFGAAYTAELQAWITGLQRGEIVGPSAPGRATRPPRSSRSASRPCKTGERMAIDYIEKPGHLPLAARRPAPQGRRAPRGDTMKIALDPYMFRTDAARGAAGPGRRTWATSTSSSRRARTSSRSSSTRASTRAGIRVLPGGARRGGGPGLARSCRCSAGPARTRTSGRPPSATGRAPSRSRRSWA